MKRYSLYFLLLFTVSCNTAKHTTIAPWVPYDESGLIAKNANNENRRLRYKLIQSKVADKNETWKTIAPQLKYFSGEDYQRLKPLILEQDIPTLQSHIRSGKLTYEKLTQWYLYRIQLLENDQATALNNIIAINPDAVQEARNRDKKRSSNDHPIFGIPVLLKDNVGLQGLPTTAGAHALKNNMAGDAFIVKQLKAKGAIVLGKTNLSEWANFLCLDCPNGYSAVGGQTLNPYGPGTFDTGGSSSGSGSSIAANYAAAAVGTETSGSILSPSSANSVVGLKPTTGLLSRNGIVPLSGTFDTPGPMTKNVTDNVILLSAMAGQDNEDAASKNNPGNENYTTGGGAEAIKGVRFGVVKSFLKDSLYKLGVEKIVAMGGIPVEFEPEQFNNDGFGKILNADMKADLPVYLNKYGAKNLAVHSVADVIAFNNQDSLLSIPYGQGRFIAVEKEDLGTSELIKLRETVRAGGINYFEKPMQQYQFEVVLSINNFSAGYAAAANYPCLTVPMGYRSNGNPAGITFIARPFREDKLLKIGFAFEQATHLRKIPAAYQ